MNRPIHDRQRSLVSALALAAVLATFPGGASLGEGGLLRARRWLRRPQPGVQLKKPLPPDVDPADLEPPEVTGVPPVADVMRELAAAQRGQERWHRQDPPSGSRENNARDLAAVRRTEETTQYEQNNPDTALVSSDDSPPLAEGATPVGRRAAAPPAKEQQVVTVELAPLGFHGVQPGKSRVEDVLKLWGQPAATQENKALRVDVYAQEPFREIRLASARGVVRSIAIVLDGPLSRDQIVEYLGLHGLEAAPLYDERGNLTGYAYPERGLVLHVAQHAVDLNAHGSAAAHVDADKDHAQVESPGDIGEERPHLGGPEQSEKVDSLSPDNGVGLGNHGGGPADDRGLRADDRAKGADRRAPQGDQPAEPARNRGLRADDGAKPPHHRGRPDDGRVGLAQHGRDHAEDASAQVNGGIVDGVDAPTQGEDGLAQAEDSMAQGEDGLAVAEDGLAVAEDGAAPADDGGVAAAENGGVAAENGGVAAAENGRAAADDGALPAEDGLVASEDDAAADDGQLAISRLSALQDQAELIGVVVLEEIDPLAFVRRAEVRLPLRAEAALVDLETALALDPRCHAALGAKSGLLMLLGRYAEALEAADAALAAERTQPEYRLARAAALLKLGRNSEALTAVQELLGEDGSGSQLEPHLAARAALIAGQCAALAPRPDFILAAQWHSRALKLAEAAAGSEELLVRRMAAACLIEGHLAMAYDVAWGRWKDKPATVERWLARASQLVGEAVGSQLLDPTWELKLSQGALAALVGLQERADPASWVAQAQAAASRLLQATRDPATLEMVQWELGTALYDAVQIEQLRGELDQALAHGKDTAAALSAGVVGREPNAADDYLLGRLYYRLGAVYAMAQENHIRATEWYDQALPWLSRPASEIPKHLLLPWGEMLVSMAVSYWEAGTQSQAIELTLQGTGMMEQAVQQRQADQQVLAVPYGNLARMFDHAGNTAQAARYRQLASKLPTTVTPR